MIKKCIAEVLGTFILIFFGCGAVIVNGVTDGVISHFGVATVWGLVVMAIVFAFGGLSGAHINPAVTISLWAANLFEKRMVLPYIASQIVGAISASIVLKLLWPSHETLGASLPAGSELQSFVLEFILTFFLMYTVLAVSQNKDVEKFTAIAVGGVVGLEALFAGPICGASMNPARSIGPALVSGHLESLWLYLAAPILGALFALFTWKKLSN